MEKINIADILKDCPQGTKLYSPMCGECTLDSVDNSQYAITVRSEDDRIPYYLTADGRYVDVADAECVLFPSKDQRDWSRFQKPFKDGDILVYKHKFNNIKYIFIYKRRIDMHYLLQYFGWFSEKPYLSERFNAKERIPLYENDDIKFATEEEKQKLFQAIKDNGYKWVAETKTLEKLIKPKFKVGNIVQSKNCPKGGNFVITDVEEDAYSINIGNYKIRFADQDDYELVSNKFDINTLKPFESRVLIRDHKETKWRPAVWGYYDNEKHIPYPYVVVGGLAFACCIPYEGNEHLHGTTNDCDEYYKTWE